MVYCHEKFKEQFLSKAEQRDTMLKSEKFKVKSFEELLQRYLKLQDASKKLFKVLLQKVCVCVCVCVSFGVSWDNKVYPLSHYHYCFGPSNLIS